ncbi:hypothetical protein NA57DRAFT_45928 [Rhizodiscina lignyota]|uniref:Small ribosomal subunit protein uS5m n=1 Tax=Rhizodiscina lignyota TaxID=1504668 RepID=A0A9P4I922_9PEZI|nr:hypothetical protein NA57DRAFT_45928 [Rhizodiscina lignyota]
MSTSRPAKWFLSAIRRSNPSQPSPRRSFHTTSTHLRSLPSLPPTPEQRAQKAQARTEQVRQRAQEIRRYTDEEKVALHHLYTPQQVEALLAAEDAIDAQDLVTQGEMRSDPAALRYLDDLASIDPVLDKLSQGPEIKYGMEDSSSSRAADSAAERQSKSKSSESAAEKAKRKLAEADEDPHLRRLIQQTGFTAEQIRKFRVKTLVQHAVVNQTRMGKIRSLYFLTIAGNGNGLLGIGEGKATENEDGQRQSIMAAIRNMKPVHRYESRTIYGEVEGKVGAVEVKLSARPPGFGNRCQHLIFEMARAAGISDLAARVPRSRNKMNVCKATLQALQSQKLPEDIARARGLKMVDARKVYYAGKVY